MSAAPPTFSASRSSASALRTRRERLTAWLRARHGVAHTSDARAAGFTAYEINAVIEAGDARRVRRSWLVAPECDPRRVAAASVGGRVTCVTAAELLGLWTPSHDAAHVAVAGTSSRLDATGLRLHWGTGPAPVGRNAVEDPIFNVLFHVARCVPRADALAVWESAVRKGLVDAGVLSRVAWRNAGATELAAVASSLSDSGLETRFVSGLRRAGVSVRQQVWIDGHPVDGLIGRSLVVQIDGFEHHRTAAARRRDIEADARLVLRGYTVLRFDYHQVLFQWETVLQTVLTAIAQGAHVARVV
jgi:very-short-patch-repair endonuclease